MPLRVHLHCTLFFSRPGSRVLVCSQSVVFAVSTLCYLVLAFPYPILVFRPEYSFILVILQRFLNGALKLRIDLIELTLAIFALVLLPLGLNYLLVPTDIILRIEPSKVLFFLPTVQVLVQKQMDLDLILLLGLELLVLDQFYRVDGRVDCLELLEEVHLGDLPEALLEC